MAVPPFTPNTTLPEDDDFASQFPLVERAFRDIIDSWIVTEHDRDGHHRVLGLSDQVDDRPDGTDDVVTIWQEGALILVRIEALGTLYSIPYYAYDEDNPGIPNTAFTDMPEATIKGRAFDADDGLPQDLTGAQVAAIVAAFTPDTGAAVGLKGLVPASAIGDAAAGKFLTAAGTWEATGAPHAVLEEQQAQGTHAGTLTAGVNHVRALNTEVYDPYSIVSLASSTITLQPGTYVVQWSAPAVWVHSHQSYFYNAGTGVTLGVGSSEYSPVDTAQTRSTGICRFTIAAAATFRLSTKGEVTKTTSGLGTAVNLATEVYTRVEIWKVG